MRISRSFHGPYSDAGQCLSEGLKRRSGETWGEEVRRVGSLKGGDWGCVRVFGRNGGKQGQGG